jgi:flavin reductase (DIM6/NTAB) family NADH-FMN oxidoreductase RutF
VTKPPVDAPNFRQLLGRFATGVAVLTTRGVDGEPTGTTVNTLTSVSLSPPLVLICLDRQHDSHAALSGAECFALNILANDQEELSRRFAAEDRHFQGVGYRLSDSSVPLLDGALAYIECELEKQVEAGDHTVFFGRVVGGEVAERRPLLYYRGGYAALAG